MTPRTSSAGARFLAAALALAAAPRLAAWDLRSYTAVNLDRRAAEGAGEDDAYALQAEETFLAKVRGLTLIGKASLGLESWAAAKTAGGLGLSFGYLGSCYSNVVLGAAYENAKGALSLVLDADATYEGPKWLFSVAQRVAYGSGSLSEGTTLAAAWTPLPRLKAAASYLLSWESGAALQQALWGYAQVGLWKEYLALRAGASAATFAPETRDARSDRGYAYSYQGGLRSSPSERVSLGYDFTLYSGDRDENRSSHSILVVMSF